MNRCIYCQNMVWWHHKKRAWVDKNIFVACKPGGMLHEVEKLQKRIP